MKDFMLNNKAAKSRFLTSKPMNGIVLTGILTCSSIVNCFAASDAINTAKSLLSKGATAGGSLWAVWGLVQLGIGIKDHNGPGIQGAIWQIIGGAIIIAAGTAVGNLDLSIAP